MGQCLPILLVPNDDASPHAKNYPMQKAQEWSTPMTSPKTYRKKPVEIQAMRLSDTDDSFHDAYDWMRKNRYPYLIGDGATPDTLRYPDQVPGDDSTPDKGIYIDPATGDLMIRTPEGDMRARPGDYIIQGVEDEFYPCKADIFRRTYEEVTNG